MEGSLNVLPQTVKEIFNDFEGRRMGLIRALTIDLDKFYRECDPVKDNVYLLAHPNRKWEVVVPLAVLPPEIPEPLLGINFARDGMEKMEWLSFIAASCDPWLLSVAFFYGGKAGLSKKERNRLFNMINIMPTVFESFMKASAELMPQSGAGNGGSNNTASKVSSSTYKDQNGEEEEEEDDDDDDDDKEEFLMCGACRGDNGIKDDFCIFCDYCREWFHGKCVKMTPSKAKRIELYKCPRCKKHES